MAEPTAKITNITLTPNAVNPKRQDLSLDVVMALDGSTFSRKFTFVADDEFIFHFDVMPDAAAIAKLIVLEANKLKSFKDLTASLASNLNVDLVAAAK